MSNERATKLGELILAMVCTTTIAKTKTFEEKLSDFPDAAIQAIIAHGFQRKFNDAVGGADKTPELKVELATAMIEEWKAGKIGRQTIAKVSSLQTEIRAIVRGLVKAQASAEKWAAFVDLDRNAQGDKLDAIFDGLELDKRTQLLTSAEAKMAVKLKAQEDAKELAGLVSVEL